MEKNPKYIKNLNNIINSISIGFVLGLLIAFLVSKNVYLDMRIQSYIPIYLCVFICLILGIFMKNYISPWIFLSLELILFFILYVSSSLNLILYVFKDSIFNILDIEYTKYLLIGIFLVLNVLCLFSVSRYKVKRGGYLTSRKKGRIAIIVIFVACLLVYFLSDSVRTNVNHVVAILSQLDTQKLIAYIRSYGKMAAVVSFLLMILQSVAAPIPSFLITLSNASIFGWVNGAILSWSSAMVGAALCFYIARLLGRDFVEKLTSKSAIESVDVFFERYGKYAILVCRLLPFVSFDFVSYAAGLTNMSFLSFMVATGIGQLPATIVYSYVGGTLTGGTQKLFVGLLLLFALSILIAMFKKIYNEKHKKNA